MSNKTDFYPLTINNVRQETKDTVSLSFTVPDDWKALFAYKAGQYLTLKFDIGGESVRRAYSMSSSPLESELTVSVKRVKGGLVSNHINDNLKIGQTVEVMPPQGKFLISPSPEKKRDIYLFGAGSGITPLISILKTILEAETMSTVYLLYGNRDEDSIIFKEELDRLTSTYQGQLFVEHTLSQPIKTKPKGLGGLFKKAKISWDGAVGRIDAVKAVDFLNNHPKRYKEAVYYICGPNDMMDAVEGKLLRLGVTEKQIHSERFTTKKSQATTVKSGDAATVYVNLDGEEMVLSVPPHKTILDVMLDNKMEPPYSCLSGACSTCVCKVLEGDVKMDVSYGLDEDEVQEGYILTCQAHPVSPIVKIDLDV